MDTPGGEEAREAKNNMASKFCSSRKNPYPPHGRSLEIPRGRVVCKAKILEGKYEVKLEFPGGGGCKTKSLPWREYGYFLELSVEKDGPYVSQSWEGSKRLCLN